MLVVIDTNVLVSSLWSKNGKPARVMSLILNGVLIPCYDSRILAEYFRVLKSPKFEFTTSEIDFLLDYIKNIGHSVVPEIIEDTFIDKDDAKFYEVAKYCQAKLITGNLKHFPSDSLAISVSDFLEQYGN